MVTKQFCYSPVAVPRVFTLVHVICVELSCVLNLIIKDEKFIASQHVSKNDLKLQCTARLCCGELGIYAFCFQDCQWLAGEIRRHTWLRISHWTAHASVSSTVKWG